MKKKIAIVGAGGMARELRAQMLDNDSSQEIDFFVEDRYVTDGTYALGTLDVQRYVVFVAVGEPEIRRRLVSQLPDGVQFGIFVHRSAQILGDAVIGEGSIVCANCIITTDVVLGRHAILNRGSQIGHDCAIGDFFSAMPGAVVSGNCTFGDGVYIGTNSSIRERISIVGGVTVGLGSGVVKDIVEQGVYGGLPAVRIK